MVLTQVYKQKTVITSATPMLLIKYMWHLKKKKTLLENPWVIHLKAPNIVIWSGICPEKSPLNSLWRVHHKTVSPSRKEFTVPALYSNNPDRWGNNKTHLGNLGRWPIPNHQHDVPGTLHFLNVNWYVASYPEVASNIITLWIICVHNP